MTDHIASILGASAPNQVRTQKPRTQGITILLDKGLGVHQIDDIGSVSGAHCDFAKIAWGSLLITGGLSKKLEAYRKHGIHPKIGGTLFEYCHANGKVDELLALVRDLQIHVEISDGVITLPRAEKLKCIERFAAHVSVFSEVGGKLSPQNLDFVAAIQEELEAGAQKIVVEGREIGPVGQEIREDLVAQLVEAIPPEKMVFEALERKQQVFFIRLLGPNVNLGNILPKDLMTVECFRRGLKEHTFKTQP